jgi:O-antigen/teichoic acid export membrane protein
MIKRISVIALLTGTGQLIAIFALKYVSQHGPAEQLKGMGEADSIIQLIINLVGAGLQAVAMRNIALSEHWQQEYKDTQAARMSFSLLLTGLGLLAFIKGNYLLFMISPLLAWSGDYALYALGYPVMGALVSLIRVAVPYSLIVLATWYRSDMLVIVYVVSLAIVYLFTNLFISYYIGAPYFILPRFKKLYLYLNSLSLGIVTISVYFVGLGLLLVVPYFYDGQVVAVAFVGLKVYVIYKGVLRIVHQAFLKDMIKEGVQFQVDQLSILLGITFAGSAFIFPYSFTTFLFGSKYIGQIGFFQLLALAALIYSLFLSMTTTSMLQKKDKQYAITSSVAAIITLTLAILLAGLWPRAKTLGVSLCIGESVFMLGLMRLVATREGILKRMVFILTNMAFLVIPVGLRLIFGDSQLYWFCGFGGFAIILLILHLRKFLLLAST